MEWREMRALKMQEMTYFPFPCKTATAATVAVLSGVGVVASPSVPNRLPNAILTNKKVIMVTKIQLTNWLTKCGKSTECLLDTKISNIH